MTLVRCIACFTVLLAKTAVLSPPVTAQDNGIPFAGYMLGPNDQITIHALEAEEIGDKPYRIGPNGYLTLPMIGRVKAAGLTLEELEAHLVSALKPYIRQPEVTVTVAEFHSQPVSIIGSVNTPGVVQLQGSKTLIEVLSMAGGLRSDAGNNVIITRKQEWGAVPLAGARRDPTGQFTTAEVKVKDLLEARNPIENIAIRPDDIISIPRADVIYAFGAVRKSGGFALNEREALSVLQLLSLAEGLDRTAAPQKAKILRLNNGAARRSEIPLDLTKISSGKAPDVPLMPDDILFVPDSTGKKAVFRTLEALVTMGTSIGTGAVIYRR